MSLAARIAFIGLMPAAAHSVDVDHRMEDVRLPRGGRRSVRRHALPYRRCSLPSSRSAGDPFRWRARWLGLDLALGPVALAMGTAALLLVMIPALGPGYWSQYVQWSLPLLVAVFAAYDVR